MTEGEREKVLIFFFFSNLGLGQIVRRMQQFLDGVLFHFQKQNNV